MKNSQHNAPGPHAYLMLLSSLLLIIIILPLFDQNQVAAPVIGLLMFVTLILALRSVAENRGILIVSSLIGVIGFALSAMAYFDDENYLIALPFQLAFYAMINLSILNAILRTSNVTADLICGGISVYLLLGVNWALAFALVELIDPGSLQTNTSLGPELLSSPVDFVYFSFVTLTTLGYGDIVPVSSVARIIAVLTSLTGVLFVAVFIGRLVGLTTLDSNKNS